MRKSFALVIGTFAILAVSSASAQTHKAACRAADTYAASAYGMWMGSGGHLGGGGDPSILSYDHTVTNVGGAWDALNKNQFVVPCGGTFVLDVDFIKDAVTTGTDCGAVGTFDDVYITFWKQPADGSSPVLIGNSFGAWNGESAAPVYRAFASYQVAAEFDQGDAVFTKVASDGGKFRCIAMADISVFKLGK